MSLDLPDLGHVDVPDPLRPRLQLYLVRLLVLPPQHGLVHGLQAVNPPYLVTYRRYQLLSSLSDTLHGLMRSALSGWYVYVLEVLCYAQNVRDVQVSLRFQMFVQDRLKGTHLGKKVLTFASTYALVSHENDFSEFLEQPVIDKFLRDLCLRGPSIDFSALISNRSSLMLL